MILDECSIELFDIPDDLEIEVEMLLERWIKIVGLADIKYLLDKLTQEISVRIDGGPSRQTPA